MVVFILTLIIIVTQISTFALKANTEKKITLGLNTKYFRDIILFSPKVMMLSIHTDKQLSIKRKKKVNRIHKD